MSLYGLAFSVCATEACRVSVSRMDIWIQLKKHTFTIMHVFHEILLCTRCLFFPVVHICKGSFLLNYDIISLIFPGCWNLTEYCLQRLFEDLAMFQNFPRKSFQQLRNSPCTFPVLLHWYMGTTTFHNKWDKTSPTEERMDYNLYGLWISVRGLCVIYTMKTEDTGPREETSGPH